MALPAVAADSVSLGFLQLAHPLGRSQRLPPPSTPYAAGTSNDPPPPPAVPSRRPCLAFGLLRWTPRANNESPEGPLFWRRLTDSCAVQLARPSERCRRAAAEAQLFGGADAGDKVSGGRGGRWARARRCMPVGPAPGTPAGRCFCFTGGGEAPGPRALGCTAATAPWVCPPPETACYCSFYSPSASATVSAPNRALTRLALFASRRARFSFDRAAS